MLPSTPFESPPDPPVPIRLYEPVTVPLSVLMSLAALLEVFPATIVSVSVAVPLKLTSPARYALAELPSMVQASIIAVAKLSTPPPPSAEFPLMVQFVSVAVPKLTYTPPPPPLVDFR